MEGIGLFETYAPVVQWDTFRLMFILKVLLGLKFKQGDFIAGFTHADIPMDEKVYVEIKRVF